MKTERKDRIKKYHHLLPQKVFSCPENLFLKSEKLFTIKLLLKNHKTLLASKIIATFVVDKCTIYLTFKIFIYVPII